VERIAALRANGDDIDRQAVGLLDCGSRRLPAIAPDPGEQRETALADEIERRFALALMLDPDMRQVCAGPGGRLIIKFGIPGEGRPRRAVGPHGGRAVALVQLDAVAVELVA